MITYILYEEWFYAKKRGKYLLTIGDRWKDWYFRDWINNKAKYRYIFTCSYNEIKDKLNDAKIRLAQRLQKCQR